MRHGIRPEAFLREGGLGRDEWMGVRKGGAGREGGREKGMLWTAGLCSQFNANASDGVAVQPVQRERIDRLGRHSADLGNPGGYGKTIWETDLAAVIPKLFPL